MTNMMPSYALGLMDAQCVNYLDREHYFPVRHDEHFTGFLPNADIELLVSGVAWGEGPVWFGDGRYFLWSDIPNNRILRWCEESRRSSVFRYPSEFTNGNTRDHLGRLVSCEHGSRRVTRTELDGSITVVADNYQGKRFNSPNDIVTRSDGSVWFTDPIYGLKASYEGGSGQSQELPTQVYRVDADGHITVIADHFVNPNGLCFSPAGDVLYIIDSGSQPNTIWACTMNEEKNGVIDYNVLIDAKEGRADGMRCDTDGNLWCGWGGGPGLNGVMVFDPSGNTRGYIPLPERCANLCFGGLKRNRLFMAATHGLYSLYVNAQGV